MGRTKSKYNEKYERTYHIDNYMYIKVNYWFTSFYLNNSELPKLSESKSESAKLKMKKFDDVLMYGIL